MSMNEQIFEGIVLTALSDIGPEIVANYSELSDDIAFTMAVQGMTIMGMGSENYVTGIYGPIPVPNRKEFKTLVYTFALQTMDSMDSRINQHGRWYALFLLFHEDKTRDIINGIGIIQPYLEVLLKKVHKAEDITPEFVATLAKKLMDILTNPRVRTIQVNSNGDLKEFFDERVISQENHLILIDEGRNEAYILLMGVRNPFLVRELMNKINRINMESYRGKLKITQYTDFMDIETILNKYNIKTISNL